MSTKSLIPVVVQGRLLKAEIQSTERNQIQDLATYLVWSTGSRSGERVPVQYACAADRVSRPGTGNISRAAFDQWVPAVTFLETPADASELSSTRLMEECERVVAGEDRELPTAGMFELAHLLSEILDTNVRVSVTKEVGILSVEFGDLDDLERICSSMTNGYED